MISLIVDWLRRRIRGSSTNSDAVLDEPFIDSFCWMCHKHSSLEVGLCKDIWEGGGMVDMETSGGQLDVQMRKRCKQSEKEVRLSGREEDSSIYSIVCRLSSQNQDMHLQRKK